MGRSEKKRKGKSKAEKERDDLMKDDFEKAPPVKQVYNPVADDYADKYQIDDISVDSTESFDAYDVLYEKMTLEEKVKNPKRKQRKSFRQIVMDTVFPTAAADENRKEKHKNPGFFESLAEFIPWLCYVVLLLLAISVGVAIAFSIAPVENVVTSPVVPPTPPPTPLPTVSPTTPRPTRSPTRPPSPLNPCSSVPNSKFSYCIDATVSNNCVEGSSGFVPSTDEIYDCDTHSRKKFCRCPGGLAFSVEDMTRCAAANDVGKLCP